MMNVQEGNKESQTGSATTSSEAPRRKPSMEEWISQIIDDNLAAFDSDSQVLEQTLYDISQAPELIQYALFVIPAIRKSMRGHFWGAIKQRRNKDTTIEERRAARQARHFNKPTRQEEDAARRAQVLLFHEKVINLEIWLGSVTFEQCAQLSYREMQNIVRLLEKAYPRIQLIVKCFANILSYGTPLDPNVRICDFVPKDKLAEYGATFPKPEAVSESAAPDSPFSGFYDL